MAIDLAATFGDGGSEIQGDELVVEIEPVVSNTHVVHDADNRNRTGDVAVSSEKPKPAVTTTAPLVGSEHWNPHLPADADGPWGEEFVPGHHVDVGNVEDVEPYPAMAARRRAMLAPQTICDRCGFDKFVDTPTHAGKSIRQDCARCKFTAGFPIWYGKSTTT